jgi:hypothetical protein
MGLCQAVCCKGSTDGDSETSLRSLYSQAYGLVRVSHPSCTANKPNLHEACHASKCIGASLIPVLTRSAQFMAKSSIQTRDVADGSLTLPRHELQLAFLRFFSRYTCIHHAVHRLGQVAPSPKRLIIQATDESLDESPSRIFPMRLDDS